MSAIEYCQLGMEITAPLVMVPNFPAQCSPFSFVPGFSWSCSRSTALAEHGGPLFLVCCLRRTAASFPYALSLKACHT